jgi:hypothetical protein
MSQSAILVGLLAATFILYVAAKGRLPTYTGVLWGKASQPAAGSGSGGSGGSGGGSGGLDASTVVSIGAHVLPFVLGA